MCIFWGGWECVGWCVHQTRSLTDVSIASTVDSASSPHFFSAAAGAEASMAAEASDDMALSAALSKREI